MISKVQVLWYLDKEDFINYALDFKPYKNHNIEGYEICDVDEDLIDELCSVDYDKLESIGFFKNKKEIENYLRDTIVNNEYELEINSPELNEKIQRAFDKIEFKGEDFYIAVGEEDKRIVNWYDALKEEYKIAIKDLYVLAVTGYDPYELKLSGKVLTYVLADILNVNESYFDEIIPNKGSLTVDEWNDILNKVYKKNKLYLGLNRVV